ncbi:PEP-CTERM sorting domain-containing protein [Colwellia sp. BRX9-1]|uniref:PEP-CTERM sorting domain-containing protein n=1 Tax=Colwellia sp. BRX9-1 TaxID=2759830 RepID=UPI0015F73814|nr:PEP-CTERM sorting domain-containing protein [Colwellia sp. BRX9-1]MBA6352111.1 PEP-CTERM sorting domain-containing protein [Colwellia sp. BRX9-1]
MTIIRSLINQTKSLLVSASLLVFSTNGYAAMTPVSDIINHQNGLSTVSVLIPSKNECSGPDHYFSTDKGFTECAISVVATGNPDTERHFLADVIAKFDVTRGENLNNAIYEESKDYKDKIQASYWNFTSTGDYSSGDWTYKNPNNYPDIRYWMAKAGGDNSGAGFRLFWTIETSKAEACGTGADINTNLNYQCMNLAQSVTTGSWTTPNNANGTLKGLSHITFFGGLCEEVVGCEPVNVSVPEPSTLAIFALGLIGLGVRRKQAMRIKQ